MGSSTNLHLEKEHSACRDPGNLSFCPTGEKKRGGGQYSEWAIWGQKTMTARTHGWSHANQNTERKIVRTLTWLHDHHFIGKNLIISCLRGPKHAKMYFEFKNFDFLLVTLTEDWSDGWLKPLKDFHHHFLLLLFHSLLSLLSVNSNSLDGWVVDSSACIWKIAFQLDSEQNQLFFRKFVSFFQGCDSHAREKKRVWVRVCACIHMGVCECVWERS